MLPRSLSQRDRPLGRVFGSLWRDIEDEFVDMERRMDQLWREAAGGTVRPPLVWGYSLQVGPHGETRFTPFGNVGQTNQALEEGWREPFCTTVLDEENNVLRVTVELPGIRKEDIDVETRPDSIRIEADGEPWKYRTELPVNVELSTEGGDAHYNNGILELSVPLARPAKPRGTKVKVR